MVNSTDINLPIFSLRIVREKGVRLPRPKVGEPRQATEILRAYLSNKESEHLVALLIDNQNNYLGLVVVAQGGIRGVHIQPRDIFKHAIMHRAQSIILGHNHPSGDPSPSREDINFTRKVRDIGSILGCQLLDHIIISSGASSQESYSFASSGLL